MTKTELDTMMTGVRNIISDTTNTLLEKIAALEIRLQAAENRLNQGDPNNTAPAGQPSAAKDYPY